MSCEPVIHAAGLGKAYAIFERPEHRLKQMLLGRWRTYYRHFWALQNVDLSIKQGETWGIIGRNGSGKSTLLQLICGNLTPTTGSVTVRGRIAALLELGAGFNPEFTGRENVYVNGVIAGYNRKSMDERMDTILAFADIGQFIDQPVKTYSSGMFARLAFAVAINVEPDILIVDEALAVGDEAFQRKCFARMEQIKSEGATVLFVSHSTTAVVDLCDHAVLLHSGECLYRGRPKRTVAWYQKLAAADPDRAREILDEIRSDPAEDSSAGPEESKLSAALRELGVVESASVDEEQEEAEDTPTFDPALVAASTVVFPMNGAEITNARIETTRGDVVNRLIPGERYIFSYRVAFHSSARNVKFYCMTKTVNGVHLGGGEFPPGMRSRLSAEEGDAVEVRFEFDSDFGAGAYFFNCGVASSGDLLHRILDVVAFRVGRGPTRPSMGTIDLNVQAKVTSVAGNASLTTRRSECTNP